MGQKAVPQRLESLTAARAPTPAPDHIDLPQGEQLPILYEDRSVLAIDKPPGWLLAPTSWRHTSRNLQLALTTSIQARDFWARSRNLKFLRFIHRLDAETSGVLLLGKSPGVIKTYSALFESRRMNKVYFAVVQGRPRATEWCCSLKLGPDPARRGRMKTDPRTGKAAETRFRLLQQKEKTALVEARPLTGRTHQIRVHLSAMGCPVLGDDLYGPHPDSAREPLALRAVCLAYTDPFTNRPVTIKAPSDKFLQDYGFEPPTATG